MSRIEPRATRELVDALLARAAEASNDVARWSWLEAAHVAGQFDLRAHWRAHVAMLRLAWRLRDRTEVAGQLLRLMLVPLGHLLQRLPQGNTGRSAVSAFAPMPVPEATAARIALARAQLPR